MKTKQGWILVALLLFGSALRAQEPQKSQAAPGGSRVSETQCGPGDRGLVTVSDHFKRLGCGFTQPLGIIQTIGAPVVTAGFSQLYTSHAGFGSDASGYGEHYGVNLLGGVSGKFLGQFTLPAVFHQDDRYKRTRGAPVWGRIGGIAKHLFVTQSADDSRRVFNVSGVPNALLSAALSNTYQPQQQRSAVASAQRFGWNLFGFVAGDTFAEFGPDLKSLGSKVGSAILKLWPAHK